MSTGRRLPKRSIIGTKVCAPGPDGLWYSGVIQDVKTPPTATVTSSSSSSSSSSSPSPSSSLSLSSSSSSSDSSNGTNITADTKYIVSFDFKTQSMQHSLDSSPTAVASKSTVIMEARRSVNPHISPAQALRRNAMIKEFRESDLIGPGFRSILGIQLQPGQRVFLTHNGRETSGDVIEHDIDKDEVIVKIIAIGTEEPIELKKRLEEVRLLESRRSARLADQERDTDFARLADMGGDRRRATSHSIEVPMSFAAQHNSRKRPQSDDCLGDQYDKMDECNAALILMNLYNSPKSPNNGDKYYGSSPGSTSSGSSWSSGSSSPPLSDDGHATNTSAMLADASARIRTTSVSTSDEGIVVDFKEETPRKKRASKPRFKCTWKGCKFIENTLERIERHIRNVHLGNKKRRRSVNYDDSCSENDHEEEFYYTEIEDEDDDCKTPSPTSPPTLSHRDMARPPHEDPEYQKHLVGNFKQERVNQQLQHQQNQQHSHNGKTIYHGGSYITSTNSNSSNSNQHHQMQSHCISASPLIHHNYWQPSTATAPAAIAATAPTAPTSPTTTHSQHSTQQAPQYSPAQAIRHARSSPRPSQSAAPYPSPTAFNHHTHHHNYSSSPNAGICNNGSISGSCNGNGSTSVSGSSNQNSPIIHSNSSANNMLQQLSQQNVTVTAHHTGANANHNHHSHHQPHQQQHHNHHHHHHQVPAVTITPNYHPHQQQHVRGHQQPSPQSTTGSTIVAIHAAPHSQTQHQQQPQQSPQQQQQQHHHHQQQQQQHRHQQQQQHLQHAAVTTVTKYTPNSPHRRTRGENKKCRKVYGMDRRDQWCTQCRWKKACSRFGD